VRDRRAGVATHVGDAGLQQGLGDGQDALTAQRVAGAVAELLDVFRERSLTHATPRWRRGLLFHRFPSAVAGSGLAGVGLARGPAPRPRTRGGGGPAAGGG